VRRRLRLQVQGLLLGPLRRGLQLRCWLQLLLHRQGLLLQHLWLRRVLCLPCILWMQVWRRLHQGLAERPNKEKGSAAERWTNADSCIQKTLVMARTSWRNACGVEAPKIVTLLGGNAAADHVLLGTHYVCRDCCAC